MEVFIMFIFVVLTEQFSISNQDRGDEHYVSKSQYDIFKQTLTDERQAKNDGNKYYWNAWKGDISQMMIN